jgi:Domain of unknown function (DUF4293)
MLQRIQSLFLVLVAVAMAALNVLPIWAKTSLDGSQTATLTTQQLVYQQGANTIITPVWFIAGLSIIIAIVALVAVFQFRKRSSQMGLCAINSLLMTALTGTVMYFIFMKGRNYFDPAQQGEIGTGFYALLAALVCNFLANRFIRRDEQFVRSQERMR